MSLPSWPMVLLLISSTISPFWTQLFVPALALCSALIQLAEVAGKQPEGNKHIFLVYKLKHFKDGRGEVCRERRQEGNPSS